MKWMGDVMSRDGMNGRKRPDERLVSGAYRASPQHFDYRSCSKDDKKIMEKEIGKI